MMRTGGFILSITLLAAAPAAFAEDGGVSIRNAVARVEVIPEARSDVKVSVTPGKKSLPTVQVRREGGRVIVDGGLAHRIKGCGFYGFGVNMSMTDNKAGHAPKARAHVIGVGNLGPEDMPHIVVRTPMDASVEADGAVFGQVGAAHRLDVALSGCGDWSLSDVADALSVAMSGSGDVNGGRAGRLKVMVSGSGDVHLTQISGPADVTTSGSSDVSLASSGPLSVRIGGSSDVRVKSVNGPIHAQISGSGDVTVDQGNAPEVQVSVAGSGDFRFRGQAGSVSASVAGSGDIDIAHATGPVSQSKAGSGDIHIGR